MTNAVTLASLANSGYLRNRIINGAMMIDQRNAGASVTPTASAYTLDRWLANITVASKYSVQQSTVAPVGFYNSILVTSTSAYTVGSGDYQSIQQRIEAVNMYDIGWGTASAQPMTLSFWARSSLTGTFGGSIYFPASTVRTYPFSYTINSANTWEYKTISISADTATNTAPVGANIYAIVQWALGAGSTYTTGTTGWQTGNYAAPNGCVNLISTNGATLYLTGTQLEVGTQATPFEWRPYTTELNLCQRYYVGANTYYFTVGYDTNYTTYNSGGLAWSYQMRTTPTMGIISGGMDGHHSVAPTVRTGPVYYGVSLLYSGSGLRTNANCPAYVSLWLSAEL